jgi:predicted lipid-binding transport protein (Tim44 family)
MDGFQQYFDIILFAMIAGFLVFRLRSVLGRRTGNERRRDPFAQRARAPLDKAGPQPADKNTVVPLGPRALRAPMPAAEPGAALPSGVDGGLARIRMADPTFDPAQFVEGARLAFDLIVGAFARGDKARLRPLLADEVFQPFAGAIDERAAAQETLETRVLRVTASDIVEAALDGRIARITLKFVSDQLNIMRAHDGSIVDGNPEQPVAKTDFWSFARDTRTSDPNWQLVATSSG